MIYTLHVHRQLLLVLLVLYDVEKSYVNAEMPGKVCPASAVLPAVNFFSPASAFRHQGQFGTAGHGLFRHCPAMQKCQVYFINRIILKLFVQGSVPDP